MSRPDSWMPLYVADYIADTTRLTTEQHGAYFLLIIDYWRNGPPPNDDAVLARITGLTISRWKYHRPTLQPFFQIVGKTWQHKRVNHEFEKATGISKAKQTAGKLGGEAKAKAVAERIANAKQTPTPSPSPSQESLPGPSPAPSPEPQPHSESPAARPSSATKKAGGNEKIEAKTNRCWQAYSVAYLYRYGVEPVRNGKVNGMLARFIERVPIEEAPNIAAFFVQSNRGLYVSAKHAVDLLLRDAEGLRTEWATGQHGTDTKARQADQTSAQGDVWRELIDEARERERIEAEAKNE